MRLVLEARTEASNGDLALGLRIAPHRLHRCVISSRVPWSFNYFNELGRQIAWSHSWTLPNIASFAFKTNDLECPICVCRRCCQSREPSLRHRGGTEFGGISQHR